MELVRLTYDQFCGFPLEKISKLKKIRFFPLPWEK